DHGGYTLVETRFEVESSNSGKQSTLALGYLIGDREESGIVEPEGMTMETLWVMFQLWLKKCKNLRVSSGRQLKATRDQTL
ncbi:hypothetical protein L195_g062213, partial [Trifolium pratense]